MGDIVLIDCLTLWVSNSLYQKGAPSDSIEKSIEQLIENVENRKLQAILVSNDVNEGVPIQNQLVQDYLQVMGKLHQRLIQKATIAIQVVAGVPLLWKGESI